MPRKPSRNNRYAPVGSILGAPKTGAGTSQWIIYIIAVILIVLFWGLILGFVINISNNLDSLRRTLHLEKPDDCDDYNPCTADVNFIYMCMNGNHRNGRECYSECYTNGTLLRGGEHHENPPNGECYAGQCIGEVCAGQCGDDGDCPSIDGLVPRGVFAPPLIPSCINNGCVYSYTVPNQAPFSGDAAYFTDVCKSYLLHNSYKGCLTTSAVADDQDLHCVYHFACTEFSYPLI